MGGRWISAVCALWIAHSAILLDKADQIPAAANARVAAYVAPDRARLIADIRDGKPDIILVDEAGLVWTNWAATDREVAAQLANYVKLNTVDGITIYKRGGQLAFPYPPAVGVRMTIASPASITVASQPRSDCRSCGAQPRLTVSDDCPIF